MIGEYMQTTCGLSASMVALPGSGSRACFLRDTQYMQGPARVCCELPLSVAVHVYGLCHVERVEAEKCERVRLCMDAVSYHLVTKRFNDMSMILQEYLYNMSAEVCDKQLTIFCALLLWTVRTCTTMYCVVVPHNWQYGAKHVSERPSCALASLSAW